MLEKFVRSKEDSLRYLPEGDYQVSLDLGCGKGRYSEIMANFSEQVYSVDIRKTQLTSFAPETAKRVSRIQSAGQYLPFPDDTFDLVVCYTVIEHIPEEENEMFLSEIRRVMKQGGILYIVNDAKFYRFLRKARLLYPNRGPDPTHVNMITPNELERRLKHAGFQVQNRYYTPFMNWSSRMNTSLLSPFSMKGHIVCEST